MAEKILSQDEVDALLRGVATGDVSTEAKDKEEPPAELRPYDLLNQDRIVRGRMPTFDMINDRFIRLQAVAWTNALRKVIDFTILSTSIIKFGEFIKKVPMPSSLNIFHMPPMRGHGLFVMDAMLVYLLVDHFFGGTGQTHVKPEGRDFTLIQQRIIKMIVGLALTDLEKAWTPVVPTKIQHVRSESNPQFAMVVSASEIVVAVTLQVQIGDITRDLFIAYPYSMLEPIKEKLYSGFFSDQIDQDSGWNLRFRQELQECPLRTTVQLGTATVRVRDVLNFTAGDVLVLDQNPSDSLFCLVEGVPKFAGHAGVVKGNQAFKVTRVLG
ncbi:MAG TPA: flagellar motor switch protein FliM [Nitrospirales bacterium]|nr:flagellar motor switch protein FliM [Nitrospirales bacterium]